MHHRHPDAFVDAHSVERRTAIDDIEPDEDILAHDLYRKAYGDTARKFLRVFNSAFAQIESVAHSPAATMKQVQTSLWQIAYGLGLNACEGMSMTERAMSIGVERATISKGATSFCNGNFLPPSPYMKMEAAQHSYRKKRIEVVKGTRAA